MQRGLGGRIKGVCHYFSGLGRTTGFFRREPLPHKCGVPIRLVSERRVYAAGKNLTLRPSGPFLTVWQPMSGQRGASALKAFGLVDPLSAAYIQYSDLPHKCGVPIRLVSERRVYAAGKNLTLRPSTPFLTVWQPMSGQRGASALKAFGLVDPRSAAYIHYSDVP